MLSASTCILCFKELSLQVRLPDCVQAGAEHRGNRPQFEEQPDRLHLPRRVSDHPQGTAYTAIINYIGIHLGM